MRRGYDRVEVSIGRSYNEIKDVTMSVSRDFTRWVRLQLARRSKNWIVRVSPRSSTWMLKSPVMMIS